MRKTAPWPDCYGHSVSEGERIVQPEGDSGVVLFIADAADEEAQWQVNYGYGPLRRLVDELGKQVRASVIDETGKDQ